VLPTSVPGVDLTSLESDVCITFEEQIAAHEPSTGSSKNSWLSTTLPAPCVVRHPRAQSDASAVGSKKPLILIGSGEPPCQLKVRTNVAVNERRKRRGQGTAGTIKAADNLPRHIWRHPRTDVRQC
jgi:hypothetical protein